MATDTNEHDPPGESLDLPRVNVAPLILSAIAVVVILAGLSLLFLGGDDPDRPDVLGEGETPESELDVGDPAPDVEFTYFDGSSGSFDDFTGKPLVLNFFAEWCGPCVAEMPELQTVSEEYAGDVDFLGMDVNDPLENGRAIVERTGVEYPAARDPAGDIAAAFRVQNMPTTVFLDAEGNVVRVWIGQIHGDELREIIERNLLTDA